MRLPSITLSSGQLSNIGEAAQTEWLVTNGLGGYSSSTVLGLNTRKYHGLLVAALRPPRDRTVCLAKLDEDVLEGDSIYRLGATEFHDHIFPQGYIFLKEFSVSPFPTFIYKTGKVTVNKTVFIPYKKNVVVGMYDVLNEGEDVALIRIYPIMTCRHFHSVIDLVRNPLDFEEEYEGREIKLTFASPNATVVTRSTDGVFVRKSDWVTAIHYREEIARGELDTDCCYMPGYYELPLAPNNNTRFAVSVSASEDSNDAMNLLNSAGSSFEDFEGLLQEDLEQRSRFLEALYKTYRISTFNWLDWAILASDTFVVNGNGGDRSVIAGYFWFESWGRDTFISLPGLMLVTGRFNDARYTLLNFSNYCRKGLIPNLILDQNGVPIYNTVDGTLWYINAVLQYLKYTGDFSFVKDIWETLKSIIESHERGTDYDIKLDTDGLISHGSRLTWMDANIEGVAVTPRSGKAVEIQALWYNALRIMQLLAYRFGEDSLGEKYGTMAERTMESFNQKYWNDKLNCLFDVLEKNGIDLSLRPNQIIAASLDFTMLDNERSRKVVNFVQGEFLTPCGLRTLSRGDPRYKSVYSGILRIRDQAYHNGAVWPWLLGPFVTGYLRAFGSSAQNLEFISRNVIRNLFERQIYTAGLGNVSEIFDGDPPHTPRGCIAQAWSVAEPLRAYIEDVLQIRPPYEKDVLTISK